MTTPISISPELQTKIDALEDEKLKANIVRFLSRPWKRTKSNEQIFEEMLAEHKEVLEQRAKWREWSEEEVIDFSNHFKQQLPNDFADYLRQEIENNEIDSELSWKVEQLSEKWLPGLASIDYILLLGRMRSHLQAQLRKNKQEYP
jgi:hypothetical protein